MKLHSLEVFKILITAFSVSGALLQATILAKMAFLSLVAVLVACLAVQVSAGYKHYDPCYYKPSLCKDPVLKTPGGQQFYFHGHKDADFCLVSDSDVHVNAHFIGLTRADVHRDFTWVQALGIQFGAHQLYIGANKVAQWDNAKDQLSISFDSIPVVLPAGEGAVWKSPASGITVERLEATNLVTIAVEGVVELLVKVVPVSEEENNVHNYGVDHQTNSMAHLDVSFKFAKLTSNVHGVLGQTYAPNFQPLVKLPGQLMPTLKDDNNYLASSLFSADCAVSRFGGAAGEIIANLAELQCGPSGSGASGMVCRR